MGAVGVCRLWIGCLPSPTSPSYDVFYSILFYSILFYSILFYSIILYSIRWVLAPQAHVRLPVVPLPRGSAPLPFTPCPTSRLPPPFLVPPPPFPQRGVTPHVGPAPNPSMFRNAQTRAQRVHIGLARLVGPACGLGGPLTRR